MSLTGSQEYHRTADSTAGTFLDPIAPSPTTKFSPNRRHITLQAHRIFLKPATTSMMLTLPKELKLLMLLPRSLTVHSISHCIPNSPCCWRFSKEMFYAVFRIVWRDDCFLPNTRHIVVTKRELGEPWSLVPRTSIPAAFLLKLEMSPIAILTASKLNRNSSWSEWHPCWGHRYRWPSCSPSRLRWSCTVDRNAHNHFRVPRLLPRYASSDGDNYESWWAGRSERYWKSGNEALVWLAGWQGGGWGVVR